jgi:muramoyltetrapeptide carboxypeptidase
MNPILQDKFFCSRTLANPHTELTRMLIQMKLAGCFDCINGIVLGSFKGCGNPELVYRIFDDIFPKNCFPVIAGFDVGHDEPNLTVPFGIKASLDTVGGMLVFNESPFDYERTRP